MGKVPQLVDTAAPNGGKDAVPSDILEPNGGAVSGRLLTRTILGCWRNLLWHENRDFLAAIDVLLRPGSFSSCLVPNVCYWLNDRLCSSTWFHPDCFGNRAGLSDEHTHSSVARDFLQIRGSRPEKLIKLL